jgi:hypothetical protein
MGLDGVLKSACKQACKIAIPEHDSQWKKSRQLIEQASFSVYKIYAVAGESV